MPKKFNPALFNKAEGAERFWEIKNSAENEDIGEMLIYGSLANTTWWDDEVTPKQFNKDLDNLGGKNELHVRINSYGGDVFAGHSILNSIRNYKRKHNATVKVFIDGIAASAASVVAMAGDKIIIPSNAMMMIHDPMIGLCRYVNATELKKFISELEKIKESIIAAYHDRTGIDKETIAKSMETETWMTAEDAIAAGYADVMDDEIQMDVQMMSEDHMNLNGLDIDCRYFDKMPMQFMNMASKPKPKPMASEPSNEQEEEIVNLQDLQNKHPELYNEIKESVAKAERERIKNIKELTAPGQEELANKAMFEEPVNAGEFAMIQTRAQNKLRTKTLEGIQNDANVLNEITPADDDQSTKGEEIKNMASELASML